MTPPFQGVPTTLWQQAPHLPEAEWALLLDGHSGKGSLEPAQRLLPAPSICQAPQEQVQQLYLHTFRAEHIMLTGCL